jgi:branched-chain amino acid transport system permease protein
MDLTTILQGLLTGILMAGIYALVAIGLTLIFGVVRIVNFAQGEFVMIGMYATFWLWKLWGIDPYLSLLITMPVLFCFGVLVQRFLFRPILHAPDLAQIFMTVGLSVLLMNAALFFFTADFRSVKTAYSEWTVRLAGVALPVSRLSRSSGRSSWRIAHALPVQDRPRQGAAGSGPGPGGVHAPGDQSGAHVPAGGGPGNGPGGGGRMSHRPLLLRVPHGGRGLRAGRLRGGHPRDPRQHRGPCWRPWIVGVAESLGILFAGADLGLVVVYAILVATLILRPSGLRGQA